MMLADSTTIQVQPDLIDELRSRSLQSISVFPILQWTWQLEPVKKILECLSLKDNWNSYGSLAPSKSSGLFAVNFLREISHPNPPRPIVVPLSSGRIQLEWTQGQRELDIEFWPDGSIEFLKEAAGSEVEKAEKRKRFTSDDANSLLSWLIAG